MSQEEQDKLTPEERARRSEAEQEALRRLNSGISETRWYPRRTQRFALFVVLPLFVLFISLLVWIVSLIESAFAR